MSLQATPETPVVASLRGFQRDVLWTLRHGGEQRGVDVRRSLEAHYGEAVNHGQVYPNLDELVDAGLVEKSSVDGRTNAYSLSDEGESALDARLAWQRGEGE